MFRLFVAVLMAAMAVTGVTLGSMAAFSATASDTGDVTAGSADITAFGTGTLAFDVGCVNEDNLAPGDSCTDVVTVTNTGTLTLYLSPATATPSGTLSTCDADGDLTAGAGAYSPDNVLLAAPAALADRQATFTVTVTLLSAVDDEDCEGATGTVTASVVASTSP